MKKRIGIMTGGGDAPGLNGIIESSCKTLLQLDYEIVGICDGFEGVFENRTRIIDRELLQGLHYQAGTVLGTSNKSGIDGREEEFKSKYRALNLEGLIAAGGDGTFSGLKRLGSDLPLIGVPKTIDNDLAGTEVTFGYDTACSVVAEAIDSLRATADAHKRIIFVEAMGRTAGWIALGGGLTSYADAILIPERPFDKAKLLAFIKDKLEHQRGMVIAVSEGATAIGEDVQVAHTVQGAPQAERYGGIAQSLARWVEKETGREGRQVVLGHLQRSRPPTVTDRFLTLAMGVEVGRLVAEKAWGQAAVYREGRVQRAPISDFMQPPRLVTPEHRWVLMAKAVGIFI